MNRIDKPLILYYSYSGNTRAVAEEIRKATGGDLAEIVPQAAYPADYEACVKQAEREVENKVEPPINELGVLMEDYETVFLGTPVWWYTIAPPVRTVISANSLSGKVVCPFATHGGAMGNTWKDFARLCAGATVKKGMDIFFQGTHQGMDLSQIQQWSVASL